MIALVTGAAGFIGSHLCDALLARGDSVVGVDNLSLGRHENIAHLAANDKFTFVRQDILELPAMAALFKKYRFNCVFHLAANSDIAKSAIDPSIDVDNTFRTTFNVLTLMREYGVNELVFSSTSAVYGEADKPTAENYGPLTPASHYGAAKLASEGFIASFAQCYGMRAWIARFPNVIGSRATHGVIFDFINKLRHTPDVLEVLGNGEQNKPYLHVLDLVAALIFIRDRASERINIFNIGTDSTTKVKTIAEAVVKAVGGRAAIHFGTSDRGWVGDVPFFSYDLRKIFALGWRPSRSSDEAVDLAISELLQIGRQKQ